MTNKHERANDLLAAYSLDALEPDERALVMEHLAEGCEDCSEEEAALRATALLLALGNPGLDVGDVEITPPALLRNRVLLEAPAPAAIGVHRGWRWNPIGAIRFASMNSTSMAAGVAGLAVAGLMAWAIVLQVRVDDLEGEHSSLASALTVTEDRLTATQLAPEQATSNAIAAVFASSDDAHVTNLSSPTGAAALGRMVHDDVSGRFALVVDGLSPTESGSGYVLWAETQSGPKRIDHFYVDETGTGIVHGYLDAGEAEGLSVTYEAELEESESPSQTVLLVSR